MSAMVPIETALDAQIRNLKDDGVTFKMCDETEARQYLITNTYLFRIKRYASNFSKDDDGLYNDLDFAVIKDLAVIDYELRLAISYIASNVEHGLKMRFNNMLMRDGVDDGRDVAELVDAKHKFVFNGSYSNRATDKGGGLRYSPYSDALIERYFREPEIWNLWEVFSLAELMDAYEMYLKQSKREDKITKLFGNFRRLRNASSHSMPLLVGTLRRNRSDPKDFVQSCLRDLFGGDVPKPIPSTASKSQLVYDYAGLLSIFLIVCESIPVRREAASKVGIIATRILRNYKTHYASNASCLYLRNTLGCLVQLSQRFVQYVDEEQDIPLIRMAPYTSYRSWAVWTVLAYAYRG